MKRLHHWRKKLFRIVSGSLSKKNIYFVSDASNWAFGSIAFYISGNIADLYHRKINVTLDADGLRNQIVHFNDRHSYMQGGRFRIVHRSNKIILTWLHGDPQDPNENMRKIIQALPEAARKVEKIVTSCGITFNHLRQIGIPEEKIVIIPLGVDLNIFAGPGINNKPALRKKIGIEEDAICVGSFQKDGIGWGDGNDPKLVKGPDVFLEVIDGLSRKIENLFVVLTGPARGYVKNGLKKIGVPYQHNYLADARELTEYYHCLDLYLVTSRCEGGPLSLFESWASGVPVVSTRVGMPADLIRHRENGLLAEIEDVDGLTSSAVELIENQELKARCVENGLKEVRQYDWPIIAGLYFHKLYEPLLNG